MSAGKGTARRFHFWILLLWLGPGLLASWYLKQSLIWIVFMSWYAIVVTHAGAWGAGRAEDAANGDE